MPPAEASAAHSDTKAAAADPKASTTAQTPAADPKATAAPAADAAAKTTETAKRPEPTVDSIWTEKDPAKTAEAAKTDDANLSPAMRQIAREKAAEAEAKATADAKAGIKTDAKATDAAAPNAKAADAKTAAEAWSLDAPAWVKPETKARFESWGKEHGLSKDATQAILNKQADADVQAYNQEFVTLRKQLEADTEFGGAKLPETVDSAKRALKVLATVEERAFLEKTPYGNHPILVKMLARAGAMLREDGHLGDGKPASSRPVPTERKLYPGDGKGPTRR